MEFYVKINPPGIRAMSISALGLRGAQDSDPFENGDFSRPCVFSLTFSRPCVSSPRFKMDSGGTGAPFERIQVQRCRSKSRHLDVVLLAHQHFLVPVSHRTLSVLFLATIPPPCCRSVDNKGGIVANLGDFAEITEIWGFLSVFSAAGDFFRACGAYSTREQYFCVHFINSARQNW